MTFERCNDFQEMFDISREVNGDLVAQGSALLVVQVVYFDYTEPCDYWLPGKIQFHIFFGGCYLSIFEESLIEMEVNYSDNMGRN